MKTGPSQERVQEIVERALKGIEVSQAITWAVDDAYRQGWNDCWKEILQIQKAIAQKLEES